MGMWGAYSTSLFAADPSAPDGADGSAAHRVFNVIYCDPATSGFRDLEDVPCDRSVWENSESVMSRSASTEGLNNDLSESE